MSSSAADETPSRLHPPSLLPAAAWSAVALLWFAGGSNYLARTMLTTMRGSVVQDIQVTDAQFGLLTTAFLWSYALASPFGGFFADRFSRKNVVVVSVFAWAAVTLLTVYTRNFPEFLGLRAALGLTQAFYIPAAVALIIDFHRGPTRALAGGIHLTGMVFGSTMGGIGGWLAEQHGWRFAYTAVALPNLALGVVLYFFLKDPPREHLESASRPPAIRLGEALRSLVRPGPYYFFFACQAVQGAVSWIIIGWLPTLIRERFSMGQAAAGFSTLGFLYIAQIVGLLVGGFWSDRFSLKNPRSRIIIPALAILFTAPFFFFNVWHQQLSMMMLSLSLYGVAMGFLGANTMPIVCLVVDARYRATAIGILNGCTAICGGVAVYGVGALRDAKLGLHVILLIAAVGVVVCGIFLWLVNVGVKRAGIPSSPHALNT
ncbi:MAG: Sugar phosphate permease [Verrucomicrobia bacterium]|nr:Sugar phosphate permease [Verrucomicrobiota bacterium]